jgi:hypothetical protein
MLQVLYGLLLRERLIFQGEASWVILRKYDAPNYQLS